MTHFLRQRESEDGKPHALPDPFVITARYKCQCTGGEVLSIAVVMDINVDEERFIWTMKRLRRDIQFEVEQHLKRPDNDKA